MPRTGRPRAFDENTALARARDLFWARGYGATSVQDLVDGLRLQRGSLYGAFGDKRALYLAALELYVQQNQQVLARAVDADPLLPALRAMLLDPPARALAKTPAEVTNGCLTGNTTAELVPGDEAARALVTRAFADFVDTVAAALRRAQRRGEVDANLDPVAQAQLLLVVFQGSTLVARADHGDRARVAAGIDAALEALRAR